MKTGNWRPFKIGNLTNEIARAKAANKARGPFQVACQVCGELYWPSKKEEHLAVCQPPEVHLNCPQKQRRVYDIAKEQGLEAKAVLEVARTLGISAAKLPSSLLSERACQQIERFISGPKRVRSA